VGYFPGFGLRRSAARRSSGEIAREELREELESLKPMQAVFSQNYVKRLNGTNVKEGKNKMELAEQLIEDIARFKAEKGCDRLVIVWAASTEVFLETSAVHQTLEAFEKGLYDDDASIAPSMIYAYAALKSGVPFANGAPNLSVDIPALTKLAEDNGVPICGKDFKTGQTLMKTIIAPGLKRECSVSMAGIRRIFWETATGKFWTTRKVSRQKKNRSSRCSNTFCSRSLPGALQRFLARRPHQLLPAAR
jgi:hypothetical protein